MFRYYPRDAKHPERSPSRLSIGSTFYSKMGSGSYGAVFDCGATVVKVVPYGRQYSSQAKHSVETVCTEFSSLHNECKMYLKRYGYAHLVNDTKDQIMFFTMVKIPGISLTDFSKRYGETFHKKRPRLFLYLFILIMLEAEALHSVFNMIHGDIQPDNILIHSKDDLFESEDAVFSAEINIYFIDFGLTRLLGQPTSGKYATKCYHLDPRLKYEIDAEPSLDGYALAKLIKSFDSLKPVTTIREQFLKKLYFSMTNPKVAERLTMKQALEEAIKLFNHINADREGAGMRIDPAIMTTYRPSPAPRLPVANKEVVTKSKSAKAPPEESYDIAFPPLTRTSLSPR